jgi:hypothetical protein
VTEEPHDQPSSLADGAATATGHREVDAVLASLGALAEASVEEHVAVFEAAHARLRQVLSGASSSGGA